MFDKELENKYIFETRVNKAKELLKSWHPDKFDKLIKMISVYHLAVLGSINDDVITKTGLDTYKQIVDLINQYTSKKILKKKDNEALKNKALFLLKKWNPDNYTDLLLELSDNDLIKLAQVEEDIIGYYGLNTIMDIKSCIKKSENKNSNINIDFYNGNYNEFLYNTFISYRRMKDNKIDTEITVDNFNFEFFDKLMENLVDTYMIYHNK